MGAMSADFWEALRVHVAFHKSPSIIKAITRIPCNKSRVSEDLWPFIKVTGFTKAAVFLKDHCSCQ